jgi:hypothetical protein
MRNEIETVTIVPSAPGSVPGIIVRGELSSLLSPDTFREDSFVGGLMVPGERIELPTNGLQNRCSTAELTRLIMECQVLRHSQDRTFRQHRVAWTQLGPKLSQNSLRQLADLGGRVGVALIGALRIDAKQDGGIVSAPLCDRVNRCAPIEHLGLVCAA